MAPRNRNNPFLRQSGLPHGGQPPVQGQPPATMGMPPMEFLLQEFERLKQQVESQDNIASRLINLEKTLEQIVSMESRQEDYPEQFHAGVVAYPDKYPFPMVLNVELLTGGGLRYGLTDEIVRALIKVDVDNPTFLQRISFDLYKTDAAANTGLIGIFLPLSGQDIDLFDPAGTLGYEGRDFQWRVRTSSDDRVWQTGWRSSAMLDGDDRKGYILTTEYELRRNDSLILEAQPIGPVPDPAQEYVLNSYLHIYKMLQRRA